MKLFKYGVYALCASAMLSISSCFNLDEEPYSEIIEEDYVPTEADEIALLATTYSQLRFVMDWYGLFDLQEESGDVLSHLPARTAGMTEVLTSKCTNTLGTTSKDSPKVFGTIAIKASPMPIKY
mgnify:CR=1 FL=1